MGRSGHGKHLEDDDISQVSSSVAGPGNQSGAEAYATVVFVLDHVQPAARTRAGSAATDHDRQHVLDAFALGTGLVDEEQDAAQDKATVAKIAQVCALSDSTSSACLDMSSYV